MLDAISTLNTRVDAVPSQIKTNNRQTLATVEQNAEAASRAYAAGQYLAVNGKLYKVLNDIAQGDALQENVNIQWVLLGDEVSKLRGDLKSAAFCTAVNNLDTVTPTGYVLDARVGPWIRNNINNLNTNTTSLQTRMAAIESKYNIVYTGTLKPYLLQNGQKVPVTSIAANKDLWMHFDFTQTNYHVVGVLGYYFFGAKNPSYYTDATYYVMAPETNGISLALRTGSRGSILQPSAAFTVLMQKN